MHKSGDFLVITLRAARINRGYTLDDVSNLTPYSRDQIHKIELDSSNIPYPMLDNLLNLYHIRLNNIFLGKESDFIGNHKMALKAEKESKNDRECIL